MTRRTRFVSLLVIALLVVGGAGTYLLLGHEDTTEYSAVFDRVPGLYEGDQVRVLGVPVGTIEEIDSQGDSVKVTFSVQSDRKLPAGAKAAIVAPTLVTARYLQVAPVYTSGPQLAGGAVIPRERTAAPVEFDDVKKQLTALSSALGPTATDDGALAALIRTGYANIHGSAEKLRTMLISLSRTTTTLDDGSSNLFQTVRALNTFITAIGKSDSSVRSFTTRLADVSTTLNDNRRSLATALTTLDKAMSDVAGFVKNNRTTIKASVDKLIPLTKTLSDQRENLAQVLHIAPTALSNFYNIIDSRYNAVTGALSASNLQDLASVVCGTLTSVGGKTSDCAKALGPLVKLLGLDKLPVPGVPIGGVPTAASTGTGTAATTLPTTTAPVVGNGAGVVPSLVGLLVPGGA